MPKVVIKKKVKEPAAAAAAPAKPGLKPTKKKEEKPKTPEPPKEPTPAPTPEPPKEPTPPPTPAPELKVEIPEPAAESSAEAGDGGDISITPTKDLPPHENTGNWEIRVPPTDIQTYEEEEGVALVKCWQGDVLHPPKIVWIKGKWNQLTKGDRYDMVSDDRHMWHKLIFKKPKVSDSGIYTVKVVSKKKEEKVEYNLKVGKSRAKDNEIILGKGERPKQESQEEVDFRKKLRKRKEEPQVDDQNVWHKLRHSPAEGYNDIAFRYGISDLKSMLRRMTNIQKRESKKVAPFHKKLPNHKHYKLGEKIVLECEVKDKQQAVQWSLNGKLLAEGKNCRFESDGSTRRIIIDNAQLIHDATFSCGVGEDQTMCEVYVQEPLDTVVTPLEDAMCNEEDAVVLECELSKENAKFKITKNGHEVEKSSRIRVKRDGKKVFIHIDPAEKGDNGFWQIETNGDSTFSELIVEEKPAEITRAFSDLKVNFKDRAEFKCEVSNENVNGQWLKDGKPLPEDERFQVTSKGKVRMLVIENVCNADQGEYSFEAEGHPQCKLSAALEATGCYATVEKKREVPKIFLDRSEDKALTVKARNTLKIDVGFETQDCMLKKCIWFKGSKDLENPDEHAIPQEGKRVWHNLTKERGVSTLAITVAEFDDCGEYTCLVERVDLEGDIHKSLHEFMVRVIDICSPPRNVNISNITSDACKIDWEAPESDGGCDFRGYILERKKASSNRWIRLNGALCPYTEFDATRMVEGTKYQIRIIAVNDVGPSEPSESSKEFVPIAPTSDVTNFKIGKKTDESIELRWSEPDEVGAGGIDQYIIEYQRVPGEDVWATAPCGNCGRDTNRVINEGLETGKSYRFRMCTENSAGRSKWVYINPTVCAEAVEDAKILIPRNYNKKIKVLVGQPLKLIIPYQGKPKPTIEWQKDGADLDLERFQIRNTPDNTTIFVRKSDRWDQAVYTLKVTVGDMVSTANFDVAIIDIPSKPIKLKIADVVGNSAQLKWDAPKDDGSTEIIGYQVEKRDARSPKDEWYVCVERVRHSQIQPEGKVTHLQGFQVNDLILGNSYYFRVRAMNEVGLGDHADTKDCAVIAKEKTIYKKPALDPLDFRLKPEFTLNLVDARMVMGYNGQLTASMKANPKPKLRWFKGKIEIIDNPKYKTTYNQGIVQLEIRRAQPGDAGKYRLMATNELGTAETECTVTVREVKEYVSVKKIEDIVESPIETKE